MGAWSVMLTAVLDRSVTEVAAWQVAAAVAAATDTRLVSVVLSDLTLSVLVAQRGGELPDAAALFGAYEAAVADAGYLIASWKAVELVTDHITGRRDSLPNGTDSEGPTVFPHC